MSKNGNHSRTSARHGREGWKRWREDQKKGKNKSKLVRTWVAVMRKVVDSRFTNHEEDLLSDPDAFKSFLSELRPHPADNWGYLVCPRIESGIEPPPREPGKVGRPPSRPPGRLLYHGDPAIDAGADSLIPILSGNTSTPITELDEKDDPYSILLNEVGKILETYDYIRQKRGYPANDVRKPKAAGAMDNLRRKTIDVSPAISRAIQFMIEDGQASLARVILGQLQKQLAREVEMTFPGSKVVACAWHCNSGMPEKPGMLHLDIWLHSTEPQVVILGKKKIPTLVRTWRAGALDHGGPGPGICAYDRHMAALGDEMEKLAPGVCWEVRNAIAAQEHRAIERKRPGTANRDIFLHRRFDELVAAALPPVYVEKGREVYRDHLRAVYSQGDQKISSTVVDPEKFDRKRTKLAKQLRAIREKSREISRRETELREKSEQQENKRLELEAVSASLQAQAVDAEAQKLLQREREDKLNDRELALSSQEKIAQDLFQDLRAREGNLKKEEADQTVTAILLKDRTDELDRREETVQSKENRTNELQSIAISDRDAAATILETARDQAQEIIQNAIKREKAAKITSENLNAKHIHVRKLAGKFHRFFAKRFNRKLDDAMFRIAEGVLGKGLLARLKGNAKSLPWKIILPMIRSEVARLRKAERLVERLATLPTPPESASGPKAIHSAAVNLLVVQQKQMEEWFGESIDKRNKQKGGNIIIKSKQPEI